MKISDIVGLKENLGRGILSSKQRKIPYHVFLEKSGVVDISVSRLDHASSEKREQIAQILEDERSQAAGSKRRLYGWAVVVARFARRNGRKVVSTPQAANPYHADIRLPKSAASDREEQKRHAQELASYSALDYLRASDQ